MNMQTDTVTVILDDDPTGTQTVHNITVLTETSVAFLTEQFKTEERAFFILTNSRALPTEQAYTLIQTICQNLKIAGQTTGKAFTIILRGDSTLRGHFPTEPQAVEDALDIQFDKWLICPFFEEGGRITIQGVHYIREGEQMTPVGETPFARDHTFGYRSSDLRQWVEEKTDGAILATDVGLLSIDAIQQRNAEKLAAQMEQNYRVWVTDAVTLQDAQTVSEACRQLEKQGVRILYRTGASFVQAYLSVPKRPLLTAEELTAPADETSAGGLIAIGSYVPKTTAQFTNLQTLPSLVQVELNVERLIDEATRAAEIDAAIDRTNAALGAGQTTVVFTSRRLITSNDTAENLQIGQQVSDALVAVVQGIQVQPRFFIAKGGITSSDVATKGLGVQKALIVGQALPGVPVWQLGAESKFPGLAYIVFPGNVGSDTALLELVNKLSEPS